MAVPNAPVTEGDGGKRQTDVIFTGIRRLTTEASRYHPGSDAASVREALAGFLPATGGAPALSVLHPVNLATLFGLAARPPAEHTQR